jgi:hypothetical protein
MPLTICPKCLVFWDAPTTTHCKECGEKLPSSIFEEENEKGEDNEETGTDDGKETKTNSVHIQRG